MKQTHTLRLLLAATLLAGAAVIPPAAAVELPNKTLVYCSEGSPAGFDPGQLTTGTDFDPADAIYNRLIAFVPGETGVMPSLAEKWDISPDNKVYTFHLRKGVKFHKTDYFTPTRDFNAEDVKFTFDRMADREMPFRKAYPAEFPYFVDMGLQADIDRIEVVDPYTVRFVLKKVDAPFIQNLAMSFASILSKEYADKLLAANNARDIALKPVGTGPFIFRSYTKDATLRLDGNKDYWNTSLPPKVSKLIFAITTDANVRIQKLKRNECQVATYPRPADVDALKAEIQSQGKASKLKMPDQVGFNLGTAQDVVVIPQTAVSFNPYGNSVFVVTKTARKPGETDMQGKPLTGDKLIVTQRFIKTGATRGDLIAVTSGLKPGEIVASSGLLKLRNDAEVTINNSVQPAADLHPQVQNR